jgi:hypothetical protein
MKGKLSAEKCKLCALIDDDDPPKKRIFAHIFFPSLRFQSCFFDGGINGL